MLHLGAESNHMTGARKGAASPSPWSISLSTMNLSLSGIILVSRAVDLCFRTMGPADVKSKSAPDRKFCATSKGMRSLSCHAGRVHHFRQRESLAESVDGIN